jgi:hypothetical protein
MMGNLCDDIFGTFGPSKGLKSFVATMDLFLYKIASITAQTIPQRTCTGLNRRTHLRTTRYSPFAKAFGP